MKKDIPIWEKLNLTIEEAALYSNIGVNKLRSITNDCNCPFVIYIGKRKIIKRKEFERYLEKVSEI